MDALSETLRVVRLVGAIFIQGRFSAPWCYQSPRADSAAPLLEPGAERVVIFHLITEGECFVEIESEPPVHLRAGDAVVFPQGHAHRMCSEPGLPPAKGARLEDVLSRRPRKLVHGGGGRTTRLVCGYLACDARLARMLLSGLPALLKVSVRGSNAGIWLEASVQYALAEARSPRPGGAGVLAKLAEVLFIEVLRLYMNEQGAGRSGWLAAVRDRIVGDCLDPYARTPRAGMDAGDAGSCGGYFEVRSCRAIPAPGRQCADGIPDAVANGACRKLSLPEQCAAGTDCRRCRISNRYGVHPRFQARIRLAASGLAPSAIHSAARSLIRPGHGMR